MKTSSAPKASRIACQIRTGDCPPDENTADTDDASQDDDDCSASSTDSVIVGTIITSSGRCRSIPSRVVTGSNWGWGTTEPPAKSTASVASTYPKTWYSGSENRMRRPSWKARV